METNAKHMGKTVLIVGGGIAGLAAAYTLERESDARIILIERDRLGGKIGTSREHHSGDFLIEHGPDSVFTAKAGAVELISELGLEGEIIEPNQSEFSIFTGGKLHSVPRPLASLMFVGSSTLEKVGFLSAAAKRRVLKEKEIAKGSGQDESVASFFRRRFGKKFSETVAEPLLAGTHAGDPEKMSMAALYPTYLGLEQKRGSLSSPPDGTTPQPPSKYSGKKVGFITLRNGTQELVDTLVGSLERAEVRTGVEATGVSKIGERLAVQTSAGPIESDVLIVAAPPYVAKKLLAELAPEAAAHLSTIRHVSTAVASFAYPVDAFDPPLRGNGFLVPYCEPCNITGCTFSSIKWQGRAPDSTVLFRVFMGQDGKFDVTGVTEERLRALAEESIQTILAPRKEPLFAKVHSWPQGMPQYAVGHLDLMKKVEDALTGLPVLLAGSGYRGSGIPDCIRQGREAARAVLAGTVREVV